MGTVNNKLDRNALRFNQGAIVVLTAAAFLLQQSWLIAFVMAVLLTGTIFPSAGLFKLLYLHIVKPLGLIKPKIVEGDSAQHQFAQGLGGVFLLLSFIALTVNLNVLGWGLALIVLALALINLTINFCLGCYIYFQLNKLGLFHRASAKEGKNA
jgi:hypothetical protein